ncbi:hypothetical protein [Stratiformator vulcanicus]|uniref:Uncharacterized protein n=1 Tax=Stratiformator vulcanicus TaxID=2527980 RepID=A0A517R5B7_9PLAN|nr:hypothetical protein [Stratiformator vulcanicus]QDT39081.1 hypothetical protein Pan189_34830 [Stratiformator vulcanicus]
MNLVYFVVDLHGQLRRVPTDAAEAVWESRSGTNVFDVAIGEELRMVSALVDVDLDPVVCFFMKLDVDGEEITDESRLDAYEAVTAKHAHRNDHPAAQRQLEGWPSDWQTQLAVALDVPVAGLKRIAIGGPLLMSDLWGVPVSRVVEYFEEAIEEGLDS